MIDIAVVDFDLFFRNFFIGLSIKAVVQILVFTKKH